MFYIHQTSELGYKQQWSPNKARSKQGYYMWTTYIIYKIEIEMYKHQSKL